MTKKIYKPVGLAFLGLLACASNTLAHSWIEELRIIAPNGTMIGPPGYPRANVLRSSPTFSDTLLVNLLPPDGGSNAFTADMKVCRASQTIGDTTSGSPQLTASPGQSIALRYQENGHVTLPDTNPGKATNRGTVFIYGTTQPTNDDKYLAVKQWTEDGKGGDGRGVLLATRNYDDGQCYQINNSPISTTRQKEFPHTADVEMGANMWCQSDVQIPTTAPTGGLYTLYWVWDWPTAVGTPGMLQGKNQSYTTCMDIQMTPGSTSSSKKATFSFIDGQDLNKAAIKNQLENPYLVPVSGSSSGSPPAAAAGSGSSSSNEPVASSTGNSNNNSGFKTVTVTEEVTQQVTNTQTVYGPSPTANAPPKAASSTYSQQSPAAAQAPAAAASPPPAGVAVNPSVTVTPFLDGYTPGVSAAPAATGSKSNSPNAAAPSSAHSTTTTYVSITLTRSRSQSPAAVATSSSITLIEPKPSTLATTTSASNAPEAVVVTTVRVIETKTEYTRSGTAYTTVAPPVVTSQIPAYTASTIQVKGRWVVVSASAPILP